MVISLRLQAEPEDVEEFITFLKCLSEIRFKSISENYPNRNSVEVRKYVTIEYKPTEINEESDKQAYREAEELYLKVKQQNPLLTKPLEDIESLVKEQFAGYYNTFGLATFNWSDIDGVLDFLYGGLFLCKLPVEETQALIKFIESHCEKW